MTSDNLERVALIERLRGRARYLRNLGEIKSPELMEDAAVALSAIPVPSPMGEERVTQADRDAAADIAGIVERMCLGGNDIAAIRNGVWDTDGEIAELVQFVHSFRIRAIQAAVAEALQGAGACLPAPGSTRSAPEAPTGLRPSGDDPSRVLVYEAIRFANWAAGEGICPAYLDADACDPEVFMTDYSKATLDEDWDTLAERIASGISTGTAKTPQAAEGEASEPGAEGRRPETPSVRKGVA